MKTWKHINEEQRKVICSGIAHNKKLYQIADMIDVDPTSVSKEVKRNRIEISVGLKIIVKELKDGLMFVLAVKNDIIIVLLQNINMMLLKLKKKLILI